MENVLNVASVKAIAEAAAVDEVAAEAIEMIATKVQVNAMTRANAVPNAATTTKLVHLAKMVAIDVAAIAMSAQVNVASAAIAPKSIKSPMLKM
jgi:hypothetical protein